ncbi:MULTISPECIES: GTPase Era [Bilophila]|uniref:GTPase Era n=1 Tax=Bilophila TaxID=35832 RepID=UPI00257A4C45|nr:MULTISPECIES: GTPase Era [Bilophila]MBS5456584.1 GTPase Era [Bilophila sp.]
MATAHRCGWVALMGPPNAGKSTLTNALVGQKVAIVTAKPQTTRNRIVGILTQKDAQVIFMDTPGVHALRGQTRGQLGKIMVQSAWQSFAVANCIVLVIDGDLYLRKPDFMERDLAPLIQPLAEEERPVVVVVNKVDLFHDKSRMLPLLESVAQMFPKAEIFPASALRRNGVEQLLELIRSHLPEGEAQFPEDQLSTAPMKFMAAEIIREKLFEKLYQEVPYSVAVDVEVWDEEDDRVLIHAAIYVAKSSHKAMVIGRAGEGIKAIGTAARKEIRDLVDKKVHLELWVKVREDWVDDPQFLHSLGFGAEAEY